MLSLRDVFQQFPNARESGLSDSEVAASKAKYGSNRLTPLPREPIWKKFLEKFDEPIIIILLAASLLKIVIDLFEGGSSYGIAALAALGIQLTVFFSVSKLRPWLPASLFALAFLLVGLSVGIGYPSYEGLAVMVAVILATGVAFASEYKSDREFEVLNAQKDAAQVKVIRGGEVKAISMDEIVVGDLIHLEMGDEIPADGRLIKATELSINQSLLTGESEAVKKKPAGEDDTSDGPDQKGCVYRGTQVVDGLGTMIACAVGDSTMIGEIAKKLGTESPDEDDGADDADSDTKRIKEKLTISKALTPLQLKLADLAGLISKVGYAAAILIFLALLGKGLIGNEITADLAGVKMILNYFVIMVIIIVVAVPEGLPMSVTVSLALAMQKMTRANSLVRQLVACETIGSATVICSDKTGTLTQNKMTVVRLVLEGKPFSKETGGEWPMPDSGAWPRQNKPLDWIALNAAVNSTASLEEKEGKTLVVGNSTEGALILWLREAKINYAALREQFPLLYQIHFSSDRKRMTTVIKYGDRLVTLVKGATEVLLDQTTHYQAADGSVRAWTAEAKEAVRTQVSAAAGDAMRTLAFGYAYLPDDFPTDEDGLHDRKEQLENGLVFAGFVAIRDPLRPDVKDAVAKCRSAGIEVKMITGDNIETARAISRDIGLLDIPDAVALTSEEFNKLSDEELKALMPRLRVLARAKPLDKFRMVKLLQEQNQVVAMTGDGTNDAPSLKKADVGLSMGIAGTEVAKEASKIVLLDDSFATIVKAVHWGRALYENIQRFVQFQLTINVSALFIAFISPFIGFKEPPFTVLQFLWINVIMDTFAAIALCSEPPREGLMRQRPKRRDESILSREMLFTIFTTAAFYVVVMLTLMIGMKGTPDEPGWFGSYGTGSKWLVEHAGKMEAVDAVNKIDGKWVAKFGEKDEVVTPVFTLYQASLFFTIYVIFQVWNLINCRSLTPDTSGLKGLFTNKAFLGIASAIIIGQALIVSVGGEIFQVQILGVVEWVAIIAFTSTVLLFAEIMRAIRRSSSTPAPAEPTTA